MHKKHKRAACEKKDKKGEIARESSVMCKDLLLLLLKDMIAAIAGALSF